MLESAVRCSKDEYIAWTNGVILDRRGKYCLIVDEKKCQEVEDAISNNKPVLFVKDDKPISYVLGGKEHRWPKSKEG